MNPWLSWAIVLGAAGVLYWHYTRSSKAQPARARSNTGSDGPQTSKPTKKEERAKRKPGQANNSDLSGAEASVTSAIEQAKAFTVDKVTQRGSNKANASASFSAVEPGDDASDRQWAEQLERARKGTNLSVPSKDSGRTRTVKTSAANTSPDFSFRCRC